MNEKNIFQQVSIGLGDVQVCVCIQHAIIYKYVTVNLKHPHIQDYLLLEKCGTNKQTIFDSKNVMDEILLINIVGINFWCGKIARREKKLDFFVGVVEIRACHSPQYLSISFAAQRNYNYKPNCVHNCLIQTNNNKKNNSRKMKNSSSLSLSLSLSRYQKKNINNKLQLKLVIPIFFNNIGPN